MQPAQYWTKAFKTYMKAFFFYCISLTLIFSSCHRKSVPQTTNNSTVNTNTVSNAGTPVSTETTKPSTAAKANFGKPLVVVDSKGDLIVGKEALIANGAKTGFPATAARAFTPQQRADLLARFKTVPPRVLHVPERYVKKTAQGEYYVLKDKFWYWKKSDGFFYLDENYYK
jgi:hypothetical protein